ncbi:Endoplasmic reticulum oxidoreductin-1 [Daldinia childiae]|uniref:Endoplasmic reticulum oxidoreductin-1 n=1 Tax=Daldinia childiae TaxID=326645 RepID=UPI001446DD45|nr:Endoplasmic reticulum oxidoreductin-1 [Daldinia childiae]KAF3057218.1 Endoplasmic reticulum oxidoreductin-1 [Daldinia childiae]
MKSAKLFYLSLFALWGTPGQCKSREARDDSCAISPRAIVSDACASYSTLEKLNRKVKPALDELTRETDFFSYYRLNLFNKKCPFWNDENAMCGNIACAVNTIDNEEDIPKIWRASELSKLEGPSAKHPGKKVQKERPKKPLQGLLGENVGESCVVEYDDECDERDYCIPEDESASGKGDYVSLVHNPERFTGYAGEGAKMVWDAIYRENCFQKSSFPHSASLGISPVAEGPAAQDFRNVLQDAERQQILQLHQQNPSTTFTQTGLENEGECLEKRVFYRVVSGMHASISTHLCWDFLNQTTGEWQPNLGCYKGRLHTHPERISNLYFNYALVTRAVAKIGPHLQSYTFCTGDEDQDAATKAKVLAVTQSAASVPQIFDEGLMFKNGEGPSLKEDFKNRFRNVSRVMDCVGCDKCRLWGKLQTAGYGAALKVLFEFDNDSEDIPVLKRTELVALFNTYARLSSSMKALVGFRGMVEAEEKPTQAIPDRAKKPHAVGISKNTQESTPEAESELEEEWDEEDNVPPKGERRSPETASDAFNEELSRVYKAFKIVIKSWVAFPKTLSYIILSELKRLWEFYIGLPVSPRSWGFARPSLDEL